MPTLSTRTIRCLDELSLKRYKIPSLLLMENAGRCVAEAAVRLLGDRRQKSVLIAAGPGHNGGDAFVVARHLYNDGYQVCIWVDGSIKKYPHDTQVNFDIVRKLRIPIYDLKKSNGDTRMTRMIRRCDLVIDGMFGTGLQRPVSDPFDLAIRLINQNARRILSIDMPSGINSETGESMGPCIHANQTVTFVARKPAFKTNLGRRCSGKIQVVQIGIPRALIREALDGKI